MLPVRVQVEESAVTGVGTPPRKVNSNTKIKIFFMTTTPMQSNLSKDLLSPSPTVFGALPQMWLRRCSLILSEALGVYIHLREELVKLQCFAHSYVVERKNSRSNDLTGLFQPLAAAWVPPTREVNVRGSIRVLPCRTVAIMLCQDHLDSVGSASRGARCGNPGDAGGRFVLAPPQTRLCVGIAL